MKFFFIILIIEVASLQNNFTDFNYTQWFNQFFQIINISVTSPFLQHTAEEIKNSPEMKKCVHTLDNIFINFNKNLTAFHLLEFSGKSVLDTGNEDECVENNYTYFLLVSKYKEERVIPKKYHFYDLFSFILFRYGYYGLCVHSDCNAFIQNVFDSEKNPELTKQLYDLYDFKLKVFMKNKTVTTFDRDEIKSSILFKFFIGFTIVFSLFLVFRIIISIIGDIYFIKRKKFEVILSPKSSSSDSNYLENFSTSFTHYLSETSRKEETCNESCTYKGCITRDTEQTEETDNFINDVDRENKLVKNIFGVPLKSNEDFDDVLNSIKKHPNFFEIYQLNSLSQGFKMIFTTKNMFYDDNDLKLISFLKVYSLFWVTFSRNIWALINTPTMQMYTAKFFESLFFSAAKYSTFFIVTWVALEAFEMTFKLMSHIKKYQNKKNNCISIPFKVFFGFYANCIPKIVLFFLNVLFLNIFMKCYALLTDRTLYKFFITKFISCKSCFNNNPLNLFIPFKMQYKDFLPIENQKRTIKPIVGSIVISENIFICYTATLLLLYISTKLRNKIFDFLIFILYIGNTCCSFLSCRSPSSSEYNTVYYSFPIYMGESCSLKYTHIFINFYLTGFFTGMAYFYYKDITSNNSIEILSVYKPFNFCYHFISFLDKRCKFTKSFLIFLLFLVQFFLCFSYDFYRYYYGTRERLIFEIPKGCSIFKFLDYYEKTIFLISFMVCILLISVYPKETLFNHIYNSNIFSPISRVGFSYFFSVDSFIYIFYIVYHIQIQLTSLNVFLITLGLIFLIGNFNIINVVLAEIPSRVLVKKTKEILKRKFKDS